MSSNHGNAIARVIKGGSYLCAENYCLRFRAAAREAQDSGLGTSHIGFRTVLNPELTNIQALFENPGIGAGDIVELRHTNVSCTEQARLAEKGVEVRTELFSSCATATRQR